jgi:hypothetical protein
MKDTPPNPKFEQMRDGILQAALGDRKDAGRPHGVIAPEVGQLTLSIKPAISQHMIAAVALSVVVSAGFASPSILSLQDAAPPASALRVLSTTSGSQGEERAGRYVILDPRNTFKVPSDNQVVVSFEWLGSPGKHQIAGTWKGPGGLSVSSQFEYVAASREFSAYWTLPLTAAAPLGPWAFEAQVDGQPPGTHAFTVVGADGTVPAPTPPRPMPLTRSEMLTRSLAAAVNLEGLDATGRILERGPGTLLNDHTVVTAFRVINGADSGEGVERRLGRDHRSIGI